MANWVGCVPFINDHNVMALVVTKSAQMNLRAQPMSHKQTKLYSLTVMGMSHG